MKDYETTDGSISGIFSDRISDVPRSFIREILKVTLDQSVISFAGGLPNRDLFPVEEFFVNRIIIYWFIIFFL